MTTLEKIKLQKEYKGKRASVQGASTIAKVRLLREAKEILAQLKGTGVAPDPVVDPQPPEPEVVTPQNQKLTDLLSGKYDDLQPEAYQVVLKNVFDEINAVDPLKPAVVRYLDKAKAKGLITEAAAAAFEELLNQ